MSHCTARAHERAPQWHSYTKVAETDFFDWLHRVGGLPAGLVLVECKNYTGQLANPEFDQLTGRFSPLRGKFGLLCYRGSEDHKPDMIRHCRDAALDDRGAVTAFDDDDLGILVESRKNGELRLFKYLMKRYQQLIYRPVLWLTGKGLRAQGWLNHTCFRGFLGVCDQPWL